MEILDDLQVSVLEIKQMANDFKVASKVKLLLDASATMNAIKARKNT